MKLYRQFPSIEPVDVPIKGADGVPKGMLKVKFKYPSNQQIPKMMAGTDLDICRYVVEDLPGAIEGETGTPLQVVLKDTPDGKELPDDLVLLLYKNGCVPSVAVHYVLNVNPGDIEKKK